MSTVAGREIPVVRDLLSGLSLGYLISAVAGRQHPVFGELLYVESIDHIISCQRMLVDSTLSSKSGSPPVTGTVELLWKKR